MSRMDVFSTTNQYSYKEEFTFRSERTLTKEEERKLLVAAQQAQEIFLKACRELDCHPTWSGPMLRHEVVCQNSVGMLPQRTRLLLAYRDCVLHLGQSYSNHGHGREEASPLWVEAGFKDEGWYFFELDTETLYGPYKDESDAAAALARFQVDKARGAKETK